MARSNPIVSRWTKRSQSPTIQQPPKPKRVKQSSSGGNDRSSPSVNLHHQRNAIGARRKVSVKRFPFFKLPAELRNTVYENVVENTQTDTLYLEDGKILDDSNLLITGNLYRTEYRPILFKCIARIETDVVDFDFRRIVTFLNGLEPCELDTLSATEDHEARPLHIDLEITDKRGQPDSNRLWCWLKRVAIIAK